MKNLTPQVLDVYRENRSLLVDHISNRDISPDDAVFVLVALHFKKDSFLQAGMSIAKWRRALQGLPFNVAVKGRQLPEQVRLSIGREEEALVSKVLNLEENMRRHKIPGLWELIKHSQIFEIAHQKQKAFDREAEFLLDEGLSADLDGGLRL